MSKLLSEEWLTALPEPIVAHFEALNDYVVKRICKRIKTIGELSTADLDQLKTAVEYAGADMKAIEKEIKKTAGMVDTEIDSMYEKVAAENVAYANTFYEFRGKEKLIASSGYVQKLVKAAGDRTKGEFRNFSDTHTIGFRLNGKTVPLGASYISVIDRAILFAQSGVTDYHTAVRSVAKDLAGSGLRRIDFESGYNRRLDSQARMNILEGVRQLNAEILEQAGDEFGADGVEISAHALCAPDHIDIQGMQYTKKEYEDLQARLVRKIGTLNCHHFATPIIVGVSEPTHSKKELASLRQRSQEKVEYNGNKYTRYEASQEQRKRETAIRYAKDRRDALMAAGDETGAKEADRKARKMAAEYRRFSESVGLSPKPKRLR